MLSRQARASQRCPVPQETWDLPRNCFAGMSLCSFLKALSGEQRNRKGRERHWKAGGLTLNAGI